MEFGNISQKQLSNRLCYDASDLVHLIDTLETAGYVTRSRDQHDRRSYSIGLTETGKRILEKWSTDAIMLNRELLKALDEEDQKQLHALLLKAFNYHRSRQTPVSLPLGRPIFPKR
jgi:DNA-binding MarR family transcriptional regulator